MNLRIKIAREVALRADGFYETAKALSEKAATVKRSQITGLESQANSALKVSDVLDFIKMRTARHEAWRKHGFGNDLLIFIEKNLSEQRQAICATLEIAENSLTSMDISLLLIRALARQIAAHYEFSAQLTGGEDNGSNS